MTLGDLFRARSSTASGDVAALMALTIASATTSGVSKMARHAQRPVPAVHDLQELWDAVITTCEHESDKPMAEVLAAVREAVIELQLALDRAAAK